MQVAKAAGARDNRRHQLPPIHVTLLVAGLLIFLGVHSLRLFAPAWRERTLARLGEPAYKGLYSLISLAGFALIVWGYGQTRYAPLVLWTPPTGLRHLAALLTLGAFVLFAAAYVPRNRLKARWGHPMLLGTKLWAVAHLLSNGNLADVLLFGSFLAWATANFVASRRRDRAAGTRQPLSTRTGTTVAVLVGAAFWVLFAFWLHALLIGVAPLG